MISSDKTIPTPAAKNNFCLIWVTLKVKLDGAIAYQYIAADLLLLDYLD